MRTNFRIVLFGVRVDIVGDRVSVCTCEHSLFLCVSICTCGQSLVSCECVDVWAEFGTVLVRVHVNRVWNRVSV